MKETIPNARIGLVVLLLGICFLSPLCAQNSWVNPDTGNWDDSGSWSLGVLPNISQSVLITNAGAKTVEITLADAQQHPESLSVHDLTLGGGNTNTLLLHSFGTNVPFTAVSYVSAKFGGALIDLGSTFKIGGSLVLQGGAVSISNSEFQCSGVISLGGSIDQYGGAGSVGEIVDLLAGSYDLHSGILTSSNVYLDGSEDGGNSVFYQEGGTNSMISLELESIGGAAYYFSDGLLCASNVSIGAGSESCTFNQSGGLHQVTNTLAILGNARYYPPVRIPAAYYQDGATLSAHCIVLNKGIFDQHNGITTVSGSVQLSGDPDVFSNLAFDGTLACSNLLTAGGAVDVWQSGDCVVSNLLSFGGYYVGTYNGSGARYNQYQFQSGTLTASNIELAAEWVVSSSTQQGRITNRGYFQLAGIVDIGDANEQLGRFILASNALVKFTGNNTVLAFADSHSETWSNGVTLLVSNWNGSINGGGSEQLKFGSDANGLTASQVAEIRFINPVGFPQGTYAARILNSGEVVPYAPSMQASRTGNDFVITWPDNTYSLQSATNVLGPWTNVANATSPYSNGLNIFPQQFFRLTR